ncbi:MAG TPA: YihY/virulence factor BrkB family protein [Alphaproteobacteria bacterium]|nr:YihY/virulence factor BrkB family protein [Alphaproteobacteria bacterium]
MLAAMSRMVPGFVRRLAVLAWDAGVDLVGHEGFELSGYAAFTALLALFPFLIFLAGLAGFLDNVGDVGRFVSTALKFIPPEVASSLSPVVHEVLSQRRGGLLTFGFVFSLWSASSGVEALRAMLNRSYGVPETRSIWWLRIQSILIVIVGAGIALLISVMIVLGPVLWRLIHRLVAPDEISHGLWTLLRYGLGAGFGVSSLMVLHIALPNCRNSIRHVWWGAVVTTCLWLIMATLFSIYVESVPQYNITYGSLGGVILTLLLFYFSGLIFVYGAEINAHLNRRRRAARNRGRDAAEDSRLSA